MNTIHLAIVEDEKIFSDEAKAFIEKYSKETGIRFKITVFSDGDEIAENYKGGYDIILMDIMMKFMNGMDAATKIREVDKDVIIIFITNMVDYAVHGYAVNAMDYVLKPINYFAFSQKLNKAIDHLGKSEKGSITISVSQGIQKIPLRDIFYVESMRHNLIFHTKFGEVTTRASIGSIEEILVPHGFFRSNKGYIVNLAYVDKIQENICIINGEQLIISRSRRNEFMKAFTDYIMES